MTYTYNSEEYLKVWSEYLALAKASFSSSEPKKQVIAKLEEISVQKRRIAEIANNIVRERIEFFEKNPDAITEEIKEDLIDFFLFLNAHPMEGQRSTDDAIYYRALLLIKDCAKKVHNVVFYTKYIYNCALWYNNFYGSHIIEYTGSPFYEEVLNAFNNNF